MTSLIMLSSSMPQPSDPAGQVTIGETAAFTDPTQFQAETDAVLDIVGGGVLTFVFSVDDTIESTLIVAPSTNYEVTGNVTQAVTGGTMQISVSDVGTLSVEVFSDFMLGPFSIPFTTPAGVTSVRLLIGSASNGPWNVRDLTISKV